jgi:UDP-glucose 4-epimerase
LSDPHSWSNSKILVTGASGFLGSHLCNRLIGMGAELHAVSRKAHSAADIRWWQGDLSDEQTVQKLLEAIQPDIVFHLSGHGVGSPGLALVLPTLRDDLITTVNVLKVATELGCRRIILAASLEEPDSTENEKLPASPYAAAKWASGVYAQMFYRLYQSPIVRVRPFMTYGPGQRAHKLIPYVILALLEGKAPKLSSGERPVDWIYVDDVIDGFLKAAQAPDLEGGTFDLGSGTLVPIRAVIQKLVALVDVGIQPLFGAVPDRPMEQVRVADVNYTHSKLDWRPSVSLDQGLAMTVDAYRRDALSTMSLIR